ncbi:hypothetical protein BpHYR1_039367 [Brachionus plicatilis]|uniref:Uncharacterized protein n=1 Tax=Brachionus plicatilis TaxID=10195 RepID=A0A3M7SUR4_BRAPC|nr:hypothetical protein BpHYR1_039367 [Brachionus plicatilis]
MNLLIGSSLFVLFFVTNCVLGSEDASIGKEELAALNRDGFARQDPNDDFTGGFFAAWPVVLFIIAAACLVISVIGFLSYAIGICRQPKYNFQPVNA